MILFPRSQVLLFQQERSKLSSNEVLHYRKGQHFYNYMKLEKMMSPEGRELADTLWNADGTAAQALINKHTDWSN